jgi:hypothetical protein
MEQAEDIKEWGMGVSICLWGIGDRMQRVIDMCRVNQINVSAVLDKDPSKQGGGISGVPVMSPEQLPRLNPDFVVVTCMAFDAVRKSALALGVPEANILNFRAEPEQTMACLGGGYHIFHDTHALEGDTLVTTCHRHRLRGKMVQTIASPLPLTYQLQLAKRLLDAFARTTEEARTVPPAYQVGENWGRALKQSRQALYDAVARRDAPALADLLANFCRNDLSKFILGGKDEFEKFKASRGEEWLQHNLDVWMGLVDGQAAFAEASMPPIGNPYGFDVDGSLINWNSYVNHARAYRCLKLLEGIERPVVAEIGGGFGGFAYQLLRQNPKAIYLDFDLPENGIIASYYLSMAYPDRRILLYDSPDLKLDRALLEQYDAVIMPNFMLPCLGDQTADLFINTISMSEMEIPTIEEYYRQIDRAGHKYFYNENLSCRPPYKGYPSSVFPELENFRQLLASFCPWQGLDAYAPVHSYLERLYMRVGSDGG